MSEIAEKPSVGISLDEGRIPISEKLKCACEILGQDLSYGPNDAKLLVAVSPTDADNVLAAMRAHPPGKDSAFIGDGESRFTIFSILLAATKLEAPEGLYENGRLNPA